MTSLTLTAAQVDALGDWLAQGDDHDDVLISERTDAIRVSQGDERASIGTDAMIAQGDRIRASIATLRAR